MMITLKNGVLTAVLSTLGAEVKSLRGKDGDERIWSGDPAVWSGQTPLLFPIAGGLKNDEYFLNGMKYTQLKHGFARKKEFAVESQSMEEATMILHADNETRTGFPFEFSLRVTYKLDGTDLRVVYSVDNDSDRVMYFSIGAHEGYACPGGIARYDVVFDSEETLKANELHGNLLGYEQTDVLKEGKVLPMKDEYFEKDALVFLHHVSDGVTLKDRENGRALHVSFPGFPYLLLWTKYRAPYLCIEPWHGIPDFLDSNQDISQKPGIIALPAGDRFTCMHVITVL